jgi:hypothetical protein
MSCRPPPLSAGTAVERQVASGRVAPLICANASAIGSFFV